MDLTEWLRDTSTGLHKLEARGDLSDGYLAYVDGHLIGPCPARVRRMQFCIFAMEGDEAVYKGKHVSLKGRRVHIGAPEDFLELFSESNYTDADKLFSLKVWRDRQMQRGLPLEWVWKRYESKFAEPIPDRFNALLADSSDSFPPIDRTIEDHSRTGESPNSGLQAHSGSQSGEDIPSHGGQNPSALQQQADPDETERHYQIIGQRPQPGVALSRVDRLRLLETCVHQCTRCPRSKIRHHPAFGRGGVPAQVMFVGAGPGREEDSIGLPFVGPSGQMLDRMVAAMGLLPDEVYITGIVKCKDTFLFRPTPDEITACRSYLEEQIDLAQPKVIVTFGTEAPQAILNSTQPISVLRGKWGLYRGIPIMPTFHPTFLLRNPEAKSTVWDDLKAVKERLAPASTS